MPHKSDIRAWCDVARHLRPPYLHIIDDDLTTRHSAFKFHRAVQWRAAFTPEKEFIMTKLVDLGVASSLTKKAFSSVFLDGSKAQGPDGQFYWQAADNRADGELSLAPIG